MTALAYICLFAGAWTLACSVLRLVDKLEGRGGYAAAASIGNRKANQRRADAPQGYLFRFAPLRGHRPLQKEKECEVSTGYHGSPCVKDCPDRGAGCAAHCPHGYAEWRDERDALYALRSAQAEKKYMLDAGAKQQRDKYYRHQHNHGRR